MKQESFSNLQIGTFCRGLALLLHSGVSTADGLTLLAEQEPDIKLRELLSQMALQMDEGQSLAVVIRESKRFPDYICTLIEVGERSGRT